MADARVLGLDVGGTHSRAVLATLAGDAVGTGRAAGGNPTAQGLRAAAEHIASALDAALGGTAPDGVAACVVGLAGVSTLISDASAARAFERLWRDLGLTCPVRVVSDVTVAFAAGTPAPDGTLALSGTGAVAARMRDRMPVRFRDGYGWLLGDDGSGFWIGRQAVRATLAAVDGRAEMGELARAVLVNQLGVGQGVGGAQDSDLAHVLDRAQDADAGFIVDRTQGADTGLIVGRAQDTDSWHMIARDQDHASAPWDATQPTPPAPPTPPPHSSPARASPAPTAARPPNWSAPWPRAPPSTAPPSPRWPRW